ncbi:MAG: ABC transporter permease [Anaerolineales bacterium]
MEREIPVTRVAGEPAIRHQEKSARTGSAERWVQKAWWVTALPLILLFSVPIVMLFTRTSINDLVANIELKFVVQAIGVSMKTTMVSVGLIFLLGTPLAYLMGRHQFRYKKVLDALIDLPLVLPPAVAGLALLMTLGRRGSIGGWLNDLGIEIAFTAVAVVIAQVFIAAPFYVRSASLGFAAVDEEIEQAARIDGASRWQIFRFLMLPLSRFAMLSGIMMSWARALGEFGATIIFAGNFPGRTQTMPTAIYLGFERDLNSALTLSIILVVISFFSLLVIKLLVSSETK